MPQLAETEPLQRGRGRPRSEDAREAILNVFIRKVAEAGYGAVTIEAVAKEAGVGRMTIYRWYASKAAIALDAALFLARSAPVPDTGTLRKDLMAMLTPTIAAMTDTGPLFAGLMAEAQTDPVVGASFRENFVAKRRDALRAVFLAAQSRGEVAPDADLELLIDLVYGALWYRLLNRHAPLDAAFLTGVVAAAEKAGRDSH